jgi:hypothetical protein
VKTTPERLNYKLSEGQSKNLTEIFSLLPSLKKKEIYYSIITNGINLLLKKLKRNGKKRKNQD